MCKHFPQAQYLKAHQKSSGIKIYNILTFLNTKINDENNIKILNKVRMEPCI